MFQQLQQGATIYILYKNEPRIERGRIVNINTHLPMYNPSQPQAMLNGMVTDLAVSVGSETLPLAGLPAMASSANFPDKGVFVAEDQNTIISELTAMRDNSQRIVESYDAHKALMDKCDALLISMNPERQREAQSAKEMSELKAQIAELKSMLSAVSGTKPKEEQQ